MRSFLVVSVFLVACGGDDGGGVDLDSYDPRCVAVCTDNSTPPLEGAGDVCNSAGRVSCLDQCEARIAGQANLCQTCLLEDADYGVPSDDGAPILCENNQCTINGRNGSCTYPMTDNTARDNCIRQVNPRREVACEVEFQSVSECASSCQM